MEGIWNWLRTILSWGFVISGGEISDCVTRQLMSMFAMFIFFRAGN
jgi:hypothetical protein